MLPEGSKLYDADGNEYVDYICSWGPMLLGHQPEAVTKAVQEALLKGSTYGAPTAAEVEIAKLIVDAKEFVSKAKENTNYSVVYKETNIYTDLENKMHSYSIFSS